jgi:hypothetical protein
MDRVDVNVAREPLSGTLAGGLLRFDVHVSVLRLRYWLPWPAKTCEAGRDPFNASLTALIGELCTRSEEFRTMWAAHDVQLHRSGRKRFRHPVVGHLDLMFEAMTLEADEGLTLTAYAAEPGTPSYDGLKLLGSWAATSQHENAIEAAEPGTPQTSAP